MHILESVKCSPNCEQTKEAEIIKYIQTWLQNAGKKEHNVVVPEQEKTNT